MNAAQSQKMVVSDTRLMIEQFKRKRQAWAARMTTAQKSGKIDLTKLSGYRTREDLFRRDTIQPKGQSHGLVIVLDMSSSMRGSDIIARVCHQTAVLLGFCDTLKIPVEVYGFGRTPMKFLGSDWKPAERAGVRKWFVGNIGAWNSEYGKLCVGYTPVSGMMLHLGQNILPAFEKRHHLQHVSVVWMTDGESNDTVFRNVTTRKVMIKQTGEVVTDTWGYNGSVRMARALLRAKFPKVRMVNFLFSLRQYEGLNEFGFKVDDRPETDGMFDESYIIGIPREKNQNGDAVAFDGLKKSFNNTALIRRFIGMLTETF